MLQNELKTCSATTLFSQTPLNYLASQSPLNITNAMGLMLPFPPAAPPTSEPSVFPHPLNVDESNTFLKQHTKTKSSDKNKTTFKPYNRPAFATANQIATSDASSSYKTGMLSSSVGPLSAYSNLFSTAFSQIDMTNKNLGTNASNLREQLPEATVNYPDMKDFQTSYNLLATQASASRLSCSTSQLRAQFSNPAANVPTVNSPTKTLQEKLAERQKACQLSESNALANLATTKDTAGDDVIVLD